MFSLGGGNHLPPSIAELDPAMKIVFITGFAAVALASGTPTPAGAKILSKPFHLRELVEEVDRVIAA